MAESIATRCAKLNQILSSKNGGRKGASSIFSKELLLDAFMVLFEECQSEDLLKDKNISSFVKKYSPLVRELKSLFLDKDDFQVLSTIGRGHFGQVQVVKDKYSGDVFAMKTLKKSQTLAQESVAFYEEEKEIMATANNPWITSLYYAFQDSHCLYFVMEYQPGGDLLSLLGKYDDIFEDDMARFYLAEITMAIHSLHELGFVHRDVKPDNVLIDRTGHIKLADFGSSARLSTTDRKVYSKMPVGTPEYIAPEVLTSMDGSGGPYGVECDWWSLGVVAYEMLCGQTPFEADSVVITYSKIMNFKSSMRFPSDLKINNSAKDLIMQLCTASQDRLGFQGITCHQYFKDIEWETLQRTVPPFVPTLDGTDDTSNFDEFEPESPDPTDQLQKYKQKCFGGKDLPFVGFSFVKQINTPLSPQCLSNSPLKSFQSNNLERRLTMKTKELKDALNNCHVLSTERETMSKSVDGLENALAEKDKALRKAESERDLLEKEKVLMETQIKDLQIRLDSERTERNNTDSQTLKLITEIKQNSRKVEEMRDQETMATFEDQQQIISELEQERFIINKRAHRLEEELKIQEKILEESKHRINDLHARISKMNEEAKRGMEEWQNKLDKVTEDSQSRISELQDKLNKSLKSTQEATSLLENIRKAKEKLEKEIIEIRTEKVKSNDDEADGKKHVIVRRSDSIVSTIRKREDLAQQIVDRIRACDDSHQSERSKQKAEELRKMSVKVMELEDKLFKNQREIKKLEREVANKKVIQERLQERDEEVTKLNRNKRQLENANKRLDGTLAVKEKTLVEYETKIKTLQARCQAYDSHTTNMATTITEEHFATMEQLKLQKSTIEKELKEQQKKHESVVDKVRTMEDKLFEVQKERTDLLKTNKSLEEAVVKLENEIDEKLLRQEIKAASLQALDDLEIQERAEIALELQNQLQQMTKHCESLETEKKEIEVKLDSLNDEYIKIEGIKEKMEDELKEKQRMIESQELTFSMLKSTCTMLENQVEELETMLEAFEEKEMKWDIARKSLEASHDNQDCTTAELKRSIEQEKAARAVADEKLEKFKERFDELQNARVNELNDMNVKLDGQRKRTEELTQLLSESEKKLAIMSVEMKSAKRKLQLEVESNNKYKIENERLDSQISSLRSVNFQMNQNIESAIEKYEEVQNERATLAEQIEIMETSYAEERLKLEATKAQQTKLIDFLQYKTEGQSTKKKKLIGGGKTWRKQPHDDRNVVPKQWKDMQQALEKERASSLKLQTELNRTQAELKNSKMEVAQWKSVCQNSLDKKPTQKIAVLSALQQSPSNQQTPIENLKKNNTTHKAPLPSDPTVHRPKERMHHNIPHRFVHMLNMHPVKCAVCLDTVHFGRQSSKCAECSSVCHVKCAPDLSHTCGLPSQFVEHFSEALNDNNTDSPIKGMSRSISQLQNGLENWMKVPSGSSKYGWEKKWVMLKDSRIHLFDKENVKDKSSPTETLNLDGTDGHVTIHSSVMSSELLGTAPTDLPYILRIESRPKCWPVQNLYLMAPSFKEKQKWVMALEATLDELKKVNKKQKMDKTDEKMFGNSLLRLENGNKIDMNCTQVLTDELLLIGSEEGLYALSLAKPGHGTYREIPGIGKVFQISIIAELNLAIMIAGKERDLCWVDLKQLQSRAKQVNSEVPLAAMTIQTIEKLKNCHLFAIGQYDNSQFICAATPNKLHLLRFNSGMNAFCIRKEIDTSDPCNCIYFTESSVVYGTGRFYSVDLKQHAIKEFLDAKDTSLAFAVYGAAQLNIFPIAILDVTSSGSAEKELLLCYNEFGVFVNSAGRQTRQKTLMWTRLPLAFAYKQPFLFVTHFNSIDVCEIPAVASSNTNSFTHKFLEIQNPRVLGPAISPGAVYVVSSMQEQVELLCFQGSSAAESSCQSHEDHSDSSQLSEMLRTISASSLAPEVCSPIRHNGDEIPATPPLNKKKRRSSFLSTGPFRTPSMKKRKCYEVNPK